MKTHEKIYSASYLIGKSLLKTTFSHIELRKYGVKNVIKYHAQRMNIGDKYFCHIDFEK